MEKLTVLIVEPQRAPYVAEIPHTLEAMQETVGGLIEAHYPVADPVALICDEEAKLTGKEFNRALRDESGHIYDIIAGTFFVAGLTDDNFTSLTPEQIDKYSALYQTPEMFLSIGGRLLVLPAE